MAEQIITIDSTQLKELMVGAVAQYAKRKRTDIGRGSTNTGALLVGYLDENGWSQRDFAELTGYHATFINKVCTGKRGISIETLADWKVVLGDLFALQWLEQLRKDRDEGIYERRNLHAGGDPSTF